jgi:hypothetical protein
MRRVIVESPYAGDVERNVRYARACLHDCLRRGEAPYASHLLYTQLGVLDDTKPEERKRGIEAGFAWRSAAEATVVYQDLGISSGMRLGIEHARAHGCPVEYRNLPDWVNEEMKPLTDATITDEHIHTLRDAACECRPYPLIGELHTKAHDCDVNVYEICTTALGIWEGSVSMSHRHGALRNVARLRCTEIINDILIQHGPDSRYWRTLRPFLIK